MEDTTEGGCVKSCIVWVPRGAALSRTKRDPMAVFEESADLQKRLANELESEDNAEAIRRAQTGVNKLMNKHEDVEMSSSENNDALKMTLDSRHDETTKLFGLAKYDEEDTTVNSGFFAVQESDWDIINSDPLLNKQAVDSDEEDELITPEDFLILAASTEADDVSTLEAYVFNEEELCLYPHHDVILNSFPLCAEWIPINPNTNKPGNFCAVGTFLSGIDLWDMDIDNALEAPAVLGKRCDPSVDGLGARPEDQMPIDDSSPTPGHTAAVLSVHSNCNDRSLLASGSADGTVIVWNILKQSIVAQFSHLEEVVQSVQWHPIEANILMAAGLEGAISYWDIRSSPETAKTTKLSGSVECAIWNRHNPFQILVSMETGEVHCLDTQNFSGSPVWTISAHEAACSALELSSTVPNILVTCSLDGSARVWDLSTVPSPSLVSEKILVPSSLTPSPLFAVRANPESGTLFAFGSNVVVVWDLTESDVCVKYFGLTGS